MNIAIASGKGGTGKTTVTASLAAVWDRPLIAVDMDVEAPNLHLFLKPQIMRHSPVNLTVPFWVEEKCTLCRACRDICQFSVFAVMGKKLCIFPEMCHGCAACFMLCPTGALQRGVRLLGEIEEGSIALAGTNKTVQYLAGRSRIGESLSPPLLRALKKRLQELLDLEYTATPQDAQNAACLSDLSQTSPQTVRPDALLDAPPGVSCPAMTAIQGCDLVLLVVEPSPFGLHDFKLAWQAFATVGARMLVLINRADPVGACTEDREVRNFCAEKNLEIIASIPFEREIAQNYAQGQIIAQSSQALRAQFEQIRDILRQRGQNHA